MKKRELLNRIERLESELQAARERIARLEADRSVQWPVFPPLPTYPQPTWPHDVIITCNDSTRPSAEVVMQRGVQSLLDSQSRPIGIYNG